MPTIATWCQRDWLPPNEGVATGRAATAVAMTEWVISLTPDILNGYDARDGDDEIAHDEVWAHYPLMHRPVNGADVLIVAHVPDVELDFPQRARRREYFRDAYRDELKSQLRSNNDHLIMPHWEIEVIPEFTSGYGSNFHMGVEYSW